MKKLLTLTIMILFLALGAKAQSVVPAAINRDTLESLENSDAFKDHQSELEQINIEAQRRVDSLFANNDQIVKTIKAEAEKDFQTLKTESQKTLATLKEENIQLTKTLEKEKKKTNSWLNKQLKKAAKKTKYEDDNSSQESTE